MNEQDEDSKMNHVRDELKQEAMLFVTRTKVAAEDFVEKLGSTAVSVAGKLQNDSTEETRDYIEVIENEAEKAFKRQLRLANFLKQTIPNSKTYSSARLENLKDTLALHIDELKGDYGNLNPEVMVHKESFSDKFSELAGAIDGATSQKGPEWVTAREVLDQLREISNTYMTIHALAHAKERTLAAGRAWAHLKRLEVHSSEIVASLYHTIVSLACDGDPIEPVVDRALDEWKEIRDSSTKFASREDIEHGIG